MCACGLKPCSLKPQCRSAAGQERGGWCDGFVPQLTLRISNPSRLQIRGELHKMKEQTVGGVCSQSCGGEGQRRQCCSVVGGGRDADQLIQRNTAIEKDLAKMKVQMAKLRGEAGQVITGLA